MLETLSGWLKSIPFTLPAEVHDAVCDREWMVRFVVEKQDSPLGLASGRLLSDRLRTLLRQGFSEWYVTNRWELVARTPSGWEVVPLRTAHARALLRELRATGPGRTAERTESVRTPFGTLTLRRSDAWRGRFWRPPTEAYREWILGLLEEAFASDAGAVHLQLIKRTLRVRRRVAGTLSYLQAQRVDPHQFWAGVHSLLSPPLQGPEDAVDAVLMRPGSWGLYLTVNAVRTVQGLSIVLHPERQPYRSSHWAMRRV